MSILDTIERVVFGASAAEAVEMRLRLVEQRIMQKIVEAFESEDEDRRGEDDMRKRMALRPS